MAKMSEMWPALNALNFGSLSQDSGIRYHPMPLPETPWSFSCSPHDTAIFSMIESHNFWYVAQKQQQREMLEFPLLYAENLLIREIEQKRARIGGSLGGQLTPLQFDQFAMICS